MDFEACRFDFRLDAKNGLTPSKRKKSERRGTCYNTLFKCKVCGSLYDNRAALLEHKLIHNDHKCPICDVKVARKATLQEHLNVIHGIGKVKEPEKADVVEEVKVDQKAALREHMRVVRGLVRKARGGKNQSTGRDQKNSGEIDVPSPLTPSLQAAEPLLHQMSPPLSPTNPRFPVGIPQSLQQQLTQQVTMMMPSGVPPTSMPGYVYINVPVIMSGNQHGKDPGQLNALPNNAIPCIPNFQGLPGYLPPSGTNPIAMKPERKFDMSGLAAVVAQNELLKVKQEPSEHQPAAGAGAGGPGMTLPHFPAQPSIHDLEPGEIRHSANHFTNSPSYNSPMGNLGMQLPTMVKLEDYQTSQSSGLSQMMSAPTPEGLSLQQPLSQTHTTPHYIDMSTGNVINIQPQRLTMDKAGEATPQPYAFANSDFRKQAFISTSFTADEDDNCAVDLSMDTTKSEAALAERLSLTSQTFSNTTLEYLDNSQPSDNCVLDLSKKPTSLTDAVMLSENMAPSEHDRVIPNSPRPSSTASSASESSLMKLGRKPRSGGLNSMVAKLWQTKIKKTQEDPEVRLPSAAEETHDAGVDGTEQNPITLDGCDNAMVEHAHQDIDKLQLAQSLQLMQTDRSLRDSESVAGIPHMVVKRKCDPEEAGTHRARRKRSKPDYCCITYHSCKVCKQLFESADAMWDHALQHADFYNERCDYCDFSGTSKEVVQEHCFVQHGITTGREDSARTRSEGKSKEYPCLVCGKCLRSPAGLQVHMVRHDEAAERQFTCDAPGCGATFTTQRDCLSHQTRVHKAENSVQRRYACPHEGCTKNYAKRDGLKHHLMSHTGERPLACDYPGCKKTFREAKHLKIHRLRHTDEKPMQCKLCDYACRQRTSMNWHMKTRHGLEKNCTADNRTVYMNSHTVVMESRESGTAVNTNGDLTVYTEDEVMYQHTSMAMEELETEDEVESPMPSSTDESCAEDGIEVTSHQVVPNRTDAPTPRHLLQPDDHEADEGRTSAIVVAPPLQGLSSEANFFANIVRMRYPGFGQDTDSKAGGNGQTEVKFHTCKICKQLFDNMEKMWSHRLVEHDEILKFYCDMCGYNIDQRVEFIQHMATAHGRHVMDVKEFVCLWCGREYSSRHGLKQHLLMKHAGDDSPTYPCPYDNCENKVLGKQALKAHIQRRHLKAQQEAAAAATAAAAAAAVSPTAVNLPCPVEGCDHSFDSTVSLSNHQASHSEERPLTCSFQGCDKTFREAKHLKVHKMLHTDERPLKCLQCEYSCRQRNSLNWHMRSKHSMQKQVSSDGRTIYVPL